MVDKNEIIINKDENDFNQNNLEINSSKYNFDYTTYFNSVNNILSSISKEKLLIQIFLIYSKINMFNK